jgi:hypothetical protein
MALKMEGLERPRRKRGRPPKRHVECTEEKEVEKESESLEASQDQEEIEEDADGRRRRKRKVPQRYEAMTVVLQYLYLCVMQLILWYKICN